MTIEEERYREKATIHERWRELLRNDSWRKLARYCEILLEIDVGERCKRWTAFLSDRKIFTHEHWANKKSFSIWSFTRTFL